MKVTFMGAGSTVFAKNVLGDIMLTPALCECDIALYDIDPERLEESCLMVTALNRNINENRASVSKYLGVEERKDALRGADFVINAIQVGLYDPCTIIDFEVPKKYGLRQTIADSNGIGGIFRALRTIPVLKDFTDDMAEVCPNAYFLNYTNPMAQLAGYLGRYTPIKSVGLCHSVQGCSRNLLKDLGIEYKEPLRESIAGINHMGWLLELEDADGNDLYPEIRERAIAILESGKTDHHDLVRYEYIRRLGYYCPRRCINQIENWKKDREKYMHDDVTHTRTTEYASYIMEAIVTDIPYKIGGNVINNGLIPNLPAEACVEVACLVNKNGIQPCAQKPLPLQLAAMNSAMIGVQLLTIEAAVTQKKETIYQAAMLDPHTSSELSIDEIIRLCDDLIEAHGSYLPKYH